MQFYVLSLGVTDAPYSEIRLANKPALTDPPVCKFCGTALAPLVRLPPYCYRFIRRDEPGDLLTDMMVFAVSKRFINAFVESNLSGLTFSQDSLELSGSNLDYHMAFPECTLTLLDEAASEIKVKNVRGCDKCRVLSSRKVGRIVINEETWQGEDVFMCGNLFSVVIASQRFVDFVAQNKFTNFYFIHQSEYHEDFGLVKH